MKFISIESSMQERETEENYEGNKNMKKYLVMLVMGFFLAAPFAASADLIGTGTLHVGWGNPIYAGYYLDYDGTVSSSTAPGIADGFYEYIFCVSHDNANSIEYVDFYTIDGSGPTISQAAWIADNYDGMGYDALDAQRAIWAVRGVASIQPGYEYLGMLVNNAINNSSYSTDNWALALSGTLGTCYQDYLVPMSAAPEPATMLLLGTGLIGLAGVGRKKILNRK